MEGMKPGFRAKQPKYIMHTKKQKAEAFTLLPFAVTVI